MIPIVGGAMSRQVVLALAVAGVLALAACGPAAGADGRIQVVTSTDVWGSVASAIGGDAVDVTAIIHDPTQDPHGYQSTPSDAAKINSAQLALYNGNGYDDFFAADLRATPSAQRRTVVAFALSGRPSSSNEHVFYDLPTVTRVADALAVQLGQIQPSHAADFTRNAATFDRSVNTLLVMVKQIGARHPGARVVVTEPVPDYLLQAAGITDTTPPAFERAVESDTDIPVTAINDMINLITGKHVAALVENTQTETNVTNQLTTKAQSAGIPVVHVTETLPKGTNGYLDWMTTQADDLAKAIGS
jgi:zinc/manganese transport system substrate-binding protein